MITISVDVTKLDKTKFIKGEKGIYANLVLFERGSPDQYGNNYFIKQDVSKEDRRTGLQMPIIGSGKNWKQIGKIKEAMEKPKDDTDDSVPF